MADAILDFATLDSAAATATAEVTEPVVDTPAEDTEVDTPEAGSEDGAAPGETKEGEQGGEKNADGTPKEKAEDLPGDKTTPDSIRKLLKSMKDADPANAAAVKQLHGAFERFNAFSKIFPKVSDAQDAKNFIDLVGGQEGFEKLNETVQSITASDELLYAGDPKLIDNILEDLKAEGKTEAFGKLAPAFLDKLKSVDEKAYYAAFAPHFIGGLKEVNMPGALKGLTAALGNTDPAAAVAAAKELVQGMSDWYKGLEAQSEKSKADELSPERKALQAEREKFQNEQKEFKTNQTKEFQNVVAAECEKHNNKALGTALKDYLKMPFFKGFPRETLVDLGNGIKTRLYDTLKADKAYQTQMKAMWGAKTPDKTKITAYHNAKLDSIAADIVRQTVQNRYPGYAKGGSAAGRVAAATAKVEATKKVETAALKSGNPIYVATKPVWDAIDWDKDPKQLLYIAGKAYLKGSNKFVTWRKA
jgi:hypothetical protein